MIEKPASRASVIVVTFNSGDTIRQCVESIPGEAEVIVVDHASSDATCEIVAATRPQARLIRAGGNRGFGAGCNLGSANATRPVVVFLNPDARLETGALDALVLTAEVESGGIVGPSIADPAGQDVTRCRRWTNPLRDVIDLVAPKAMIPRSWRRDVPSDDPIYASGGEVPYVQGSCMALERRAFLATGGFDESYFLYAEEELLARQLTAQGRPTRLVPSARIVHIGHVSTDGTGTFATQEMFRSRARLYIGMYGWVGGTLAVGLNALAVSFLWAAWPVRRVISYRRLESDEWCAAAARGLVLGLFDRPTRLPPLSALPGVGLNN